MSYLRKQEGVAQLLVVGLVAVVVVVVGLAIWQAQKSSNKSDPATPKATATPAAQSSPSPTPVATPVPTDQELITSLVKSNLEKGGNKPSSGTVLRLYALQGDYALVGILVSSGVGGGENLLKRSNGTWTIVYDGQNLDGTKAASLGAPAAIANSGSSSSPILFTY